MPPPVWKDVQIVLHVLVLYPQVVKRKHRRRAAALANSIILKRGKGANKIMQEVTQGHTVICTIGQLDKQGNPMITPVPYDAPPAWSSTTTPPVDALTVSADGTECDVATSGGSIPTIATGGQASDTINLAVKVGGVEFDASLSLVIDAQPQVLGSVVILTQVQ